MTTIYHITHINNLPKILAADGLCCDNSIQSKNLNPVGIAHSHIKARRARTMVPCATSGVLPDYVPFYFAPRSPMLYAIHRGNVAGYTGTQADVVHLVSTVETVCEAPLPFVFTDGHAEMAISEFFTDVQLLKRVDWQVMSATYWNDTT